MRGNGLTPAVSYLRMSTDQQETSIAQQKKEIAAYAKSEGYYIIREYKDEGKSGSKHPEKRVDFMRLLLDATAKGDFKAVLCWDSSRFTRQDGIDSAFPKQTLRNANIILDTVKGGRIDWNRFEGRLQDFVESELNHRYSEDLGKNVVRGKQDAYDDGRLPWGPVCFGYRRRYWSDSGQECIIRRGESFRKPKGWRSEVLIEEDEAEIVRFIFKHYSERDSSLRELAHQLADKGITPPSP